MKEPEKILVDQFGRTHDYLRISLTERCNLRCFYCMPENGVELREKSVFMTFEEILTIAKVFVKLGVKKIRLTGGEPLIKKGFDHLIHQLGELPVELAITTNAVLLDVYMEDLKKAGVRSINISLDSLKEDRMNQISRRNYFHRIMENIHLMLRNDFKVKINVVLIRGVNDDEIIDFINWTQDKNVIVRFIEFMPFDGNNWKMDKKISQKEILELLDQHYGQDKVKRISDEKNDTSRNYKIQNYKGSFGIISSVSNPFCDSCNRIRLTADGKIKNCLFSKGETDLLKYVRQNKNIEDLIIKNVLHKKKSRGGIGVFDDNSVKKLKNRSMITIGG